MRTCWTLMLLLSIGCGRVSPFDPGTGGGSGGSGGSAGGGAGGGSNAACANLDEVACGATAGCVADWCLACSCTPSFNGCRAPNAAVHQCPLLDCVSPQCCHDQSDCVAAGFCALPGSAQFCGACRVDPGNCGQDLDCSTGQVCLPMPCSCNGATECTAGCTSNTDCEDGQQCSGGAHPRCVPKSCATTANCPRSFSCVGAACVRKTCSSDAACDPSGASFCLGGACYGSLGVCQQAVP